MGQGLREPQTALLQQTCRLADAMSPCQIGCALTPTQKGGLGRARVVVWEAVNRLRPRAGCILVYRRT